MLTPPLPLHLSGPPDESAQLAVSTRHRADPAPQSPGSVVYLWRKQAQTATFNHSAYRHRDERVG
jgi:hypothetical protein